MSDACQILVNPKSMHDASNRFNARMHIIYPLPIKSVKQRFEQNAELLQMMEVFRQMVNHSIRIGLEFNCSTIKKLCPLTYRQLENYPIMSYYKLTAMSQACGRLSQMKRDIKKGRNPKSPYVQKPYLVSCYGFKINGMLLSIPIGKRKYANILLNDHTAKTISDKSLKIKSFTITPTSLSLSMQKEIVPFIPEKTIGIDRNERNITFGNDEKIVYVDTAKLSKMKENYSSIKSTFRRNDHRIRKKLYSKFGRRQSNREKQALHIASKCIVEYAKRQNAMIILEDIKGIRKLYKKGNGQGKKFRRRMNSWSFYELERQVKYKAVWEGVPVKCIDPKRTSTLCPVCGGRLQGDRQRPRDLWCSSCERWRNRDVVASMNIAYKGWLRFIHPEDDICEAMKGNPKEPVILRVDVSKCLEVMSMTPDKLIEPIQSDV
ncbi:MAG TPA: transposase [Candidatus Nitrosotenuis sp.]